MFAEISGGMEAVEASGLVFDPHSPQPPLSQSWERGEALPLLTGWFGFSRQDERISQ